jgi:hypothetical protein
MDNDERLSWQRIGLAILICAHIVFCCISLVHVAGFNSPNAFSPARFHIFYNPAQLRTAVMAVGTFALVSSLFIFARFGPGYFIGFYFYTMILDYLWLNCFTDLSYDHRLAGLSAAVSAVAFLLPALFFTAPFRQVYVLSATAFDRLLTFILLLAAVTIAIGATYNFRLVGIESIYDFRNQNESPRILSYAIGMTSGALLPFAFAVFTARKAYWRTGAVLFLLLLLYPVTLTKSALFAPVWLVSMLLLSKLVEARIAVVLSLLAPVTGGLLLIVLFDERAAAVLFSTINFRMVVIPATAMDIYNDFFSKHDLTYFCQISVLKPIMACPYRDPLGTVMAEAYKLGGFNASLFATEGIASIGAHFAPISVFLCGLVIAVGNRLSAGLPAGFVLVSGSILPQVLLNVPLTTVLLTHGAGLLFLLWYVTPRAMFQTADGSQSTVQDKIPTGLSATR